MGEADRWRRAYDQTCLERDDFAMRAEVAEAKLAKLASTLSVNAMRDQVREVEINLSGMKWPKGSDEVVARAIRLITDLHIAAVFNDAQRARAASHVDRLDAALRVVLQGYRVIRMAQGMTAEEVAKLPAVQTAEATLKQPGPEKLASPSKPIEGPWAYCCNMDPATCDCTYPDHGMAHFPASRDKSDP